MPHVLIVVADFYQDIAAELSRGAREFLQEKGCSFEETSVPGALEIPPVIGYALASKRFDGFVALGCVIRGETTHYDYVCEQSARGLMDLNLHQQAAIGNGILTVEDDAQAWKRARTTEGNKGARAAEAALSLIEHRKQFQS